MKYNLFDLGSLRDTLQICKSKPCLNHITINTLSLVYWPQSLHAMYRNISKMADQSQTVNPRMHYVVLTVTSSVCLKLSQSMRIVSVLLLPDMYHLMAMGHSKFQCQSTVFMPGQAIWFVQEKSLRNDMWYVHYLLIRWQVVPSSWSVPLNAFIQLPILKVRH